MTTRTTDGALRVAIVSGAAPGIGAGRSSRSPGPAGPSSRLTALTILGSPTTWGPLPRLAAYGAAKAGVAGLVRGLAADLAGSGVTANGVAPGPTSTTMLDVTAEIYGFANVADFAHNPLHGRLLQPDEIAAPIAWLCSRESSSLTGHVLPTDAGMTT